MALHLFCYTSLGFEQARAALDTIKEARDFDYEADFIPSSVGPTTPDAQYVARQFTGVDQQAYFLVRLNNKSVLDQDTIRELVRTLKSGFPDLLVLWEGERSI